MLPPESGMPATASMPRRRSLSRAGTFWPPPPGFDPQMARLGYPHIPMLSIVMLVCALVLSAAVVGPSGPSYMVLSLAPVAGMVATAWYYHKEHITMHILLEQFWAGAILSILAASVFEVMFQLQTRKIWACQAHSPSVSCDLKFILVVITGVGLVEEVSKILPMTRIHTSWKHYMTCHQWWYRLVDTPRPYALSGLAAAAGFAAVENIKYVFSEAGSTRSIGTSLWRAVLAIPFHLACTTYAAATVASFVFTAPSEDWNMTTEAAGSNILRPETSDSGGANNLQAPDESSSLAQAAAGTAASPLLWRQSQLQGVPAAAATGIAVATGSEASIAAAATHTMLPPVHCGYGGRDWRWEPFETLDANACVWFVALFLPAILHGFYDAGLFLAMQFVAHTDSDPTDPLKARLLIQSLGHGMLKGVLYSSVASTAATAVRSGETAAYVGLSVFAAALRGLSDTTTFPAPPQIPIAAHSLGTNAAYQTLALLSIGVSFTCYLSMLWLAVRKFQSLPHSPPL